MIIPGSLNTNGFTYKENLLDFILCMYPMNSHIFFMMPCCDVIMEIVAVSLKRRTDSYRTDLLPGNLLIQNTILIRYNAHNYAVLAQLVEHSAVNRAVTGPSPVDGVPISFFLIFSYLIRTKSGL
jgi:hypothetical protein